MTMVNSQFKNMHSMLDRYFFLRITYILYTTRAEHQAKHKRKYEIIQSMSKTLTLFPSYFF